MRIAERGNRIQIVRPFHSRVAIGSIGVVGSLVTQNIKHRGRPTWFGLVYFSFDKHPFLVSLDLDITPAMKVWFSSDG
jgi:hypothetical protein